MSKERNVKQNQENENRITNIAERLSLAYSARQNFDEAIKIRDEMRLRFWPLDLTYYIAKEQIKAGSDPTPQITLLEEALKAKNIDPQTKRHAIYSLANLFLKIDQPEKAFETVSKDRYYGSLRSIDTDLKIAKALQASGLDPAPALQRAIENKGKYVLESSIDIKVKFDDHNLARDNVLIAKTVYELNKDPFPFLSRSLQIADKEGYRKKDSYFSVAVAYAFCDNLDMAFKVADKITEDIKDLHPENKKHAFEQKTNALKKIAEIRLKKNDIEGALKSANKANDRVFTTQLAADGALQNLDNQDLSLDLFNLSLKYLKGISIPETSKLTHFPADYFKAKKAEIYSLLGRASKFLDKNPDRFFVYAKKYADNIENHVYKEQAYSNIAKNESLCNKDATATWKKAAEVLDENFKSIEEPDEIEIIEYLMDLEELSMNLAKSGYYDLAITTINKACSVAPEGLNEQTFKAEILATVASKQAKEGLSVKEMDNLSPKDIKAILSGNNEAAKEAVVYFGLDRKIK